jgi:hypothetical protein
MMMPPKATTPTEPEPQAIIRVTGPETGRWRGGFGTPRHFTPDVQEFDDLTLSAEEIAELQGDPELKVEITALGTSPDTPPA